MAVPKTRGWREGSQLHQFGSVGTLWPMDDAGDPFVTPAGDVGNAEIRSTDNGVLVPGSLNAYLATRTDDVASAIRSLVAGLAPAGLWTPIAEPAAKRAALSPCRFDAALLLRRERHGVSAVIAAATWSVTLIGDEAWIDVMWPSDAWAEAMDGQPVRSQIDFPFLDDALAVRGSEPFGAYMRFHCGLDTDAS